MIEAASSRKFPKHLLAGALVKCPEWEAPFNLAEPNTTREQEVCVGWQGVDEPHELLRAGAFDVVYDDERSRARQRSSEILDAPGELLIERPSEVVCHAQQVAGPSGNLADTA